MSTSCLCAAARSEPTCQRYTKPSLPAVMRYASSGLQRSESTRSECALKFRTVAPVYVSTMATPLLAFAAKNWPPWENATALARRMGKSLTALMSSISTFISCSVDSNATSTCRPEGWNATAVGISLKRFTSSRVGTVSCGTLAPGPKYCE